MARCLIGGSLGEQPALLPLDAWEVLPKDHLVWEVIGQVDKLDLEPFLAVYRVDGVGHPPSDQTAMTALFFSCYRKRCLFLRDIRTACQDDLGARVILGGKVPSISTLSEFTSVHREALRGLLPATLAMADREGLVDLSVVAGDGTKMVANAAMKTTTDEEGLRAQIADLSEQIEVTAAVWAEQVAATAAVADASPSGTPDPDLDDDLTRAGAMGSSGMVGQVRAGGGQDATWRRLGVLNRLMACRQEALAWLTGHPPQTATEDWQAQLARDNDRVARATARVNALQARLQAAGDTRQADLAAGKVFRGALVPVEANSRLARERQALHAATARAARTAANRPVAARVNTTDPTSGNHAGQTGRVRSAVQRAGDVLLRSTHPRYRRAPQRQ